MSSFKMNPRRSGKLGFTLIELLVVIAIIALLAAILFPVFSRARENARRSTCQSNLKQLGLGMLQYFQDYDEYPPCGTVGFGATAGEGWAGQVLPYITNTQVFICPDDGGRPGVKPAAGQAYYGYLSNVGLIIDQMGGVPVVVRPIMAYTATSMTVMLYEGEDYAYALVPGEALSPVGNGSTEDTGGVAVPTRCSMQPVAGWIGSLGTSPTARHFDGGNYLCADGHVKWCLPEQVSYGFHAATPEAAGFVGTGTNTRFADGTSYAAGNNHVVTMSYR